MNYKQPQSGPYNIDWNNPLSRALCFAWIPGAGEMDLVSRRIGVKEGATYTPEVAHGNMKYKRFDSGAHDVNFGGGSAYDFRGLSNQTIFVELYIEDSSTIDGYILGRVQSNWDYFLTATAGSQQITFGTGGTTGSGAVAFPPTSVFQGLLPYNKRRLPVCGTYDKVTASLYVDGKLGNSAAQTGSFPSTTDPFALGGRGGTQPTGTGYSLGVVFMFKRTLTPQEVASLSDNPWQLFLDEEDEDEALYFSVSAGSTILSATGASAGTCNLTSVAQALAQAFGTATGVGNVSATSRTVFSVDGSSSGTTGGSATGVSITQATGASSGIGSAASTSVTIKTTNGSSSGQVTLSGVGNCIWQVSGASAGISTVLATGADGNSGGVSPSNGSSSGSGTVSATARSLYTASGTASGASSASGTAQAFSQTIANAVAASTASAGSVIIAVSTGDSTSISTVSGTTNILKGASGSAAGTSTAQSTTVVVFEASGFSVGASVIDAVTGAIKSAVARANGSATVTGITEGGVHYTAIGDKFNVTVMFAPYAIVVESNPYEIKLNKQPYTITLN